MLKNIYWANIIIALLTSSAQVTSDVPKCINISDDALLEKKKKKVISQGWDMM